MNSNMDAKSRTKWVDVAKLIGMVAIVYGHTVQDGWTCRYVYSFHVPMFFFLQGVVFSVSRSDNKPFLKYLKAKAYSLLLPYFIFAIVSTLIFYIMARFITLPETEIFMSVETVVLPLIMGKCEANNPLWFLPCLFVMSIITYGIIRWLNSKTNVIRKAYMLFGISAVSIAFLYLIEAFTAIKFLPWKMDTAVYMLPLFILGYAFEEYGWFKTIFDFCILKKVIIAIVLICCGAIIGLLNGESNYLGNYYDNVFLMYISSALSTVGYCIVASMLKNIPAFIYCGQNTLGILLMHKFPILFFQKIVPVTRSLLNRNNVVIGFLVAVISIALCLVANLILEKIAPFAIGKKFGKEINST